MKTIYKLITKRALLSILIVHLSVMGFAATYYVSNSGNDSYDGKSPEKPWKTLTKVNMIMFNAGDSILFNSGDVFFDNRLELYNKQDLIISSYGGIPKPEIRAYGELPEWNLDENWSLHSTGIYRMSYLNTLTRRLWINGAEKKESQTLVLTNDFPWRIEGGYLYIKASTNPASVFKSIIISNKMFSAIKLVGSDNININNIKLTGGDNSFLILNSKNIIIENCEIGYRTSQAGIRLASEIFGSDVGAIVRNNILSTGDSLNYSYFRSHRATFDGVYLGSGSCNSKVYDNYFYGWSHAAVELVVTNENFPCNNNEIYNNYITAPLIDYARGLVADFHSGGYNNSFHHNMIVNTSVRNQFNGNGLKVYGNIIDNVKGCDYPEKDNVGQGISIEGYATPATNMEIFDNTVLNCANEGIAIWGTNTFEKSNNYVHDNNIFNNNLFSFYQLFIYTALSTVNNNTIANNHFYNRNSGDVVRYFPNNYSVENFNNVTTSNGDSISGNDAILKYGKYTTKINDLIIEHNGSPITKTISIDQPMIDSKGNKYLGSVTIPKYSSLILLKDPTKYLTEYKTICEGTSYNGWTISGEYERTLQTKLGSDSIVTTVLTVNPKYAITEDIIINEGEEYRGWTATGKYSRTLISVSGCDSIITTNLTVVSSTIKQGSIIPTHFIPVWQGENGLNHMNFMVVSASLEDLPLSPEDEIAVFSGETCVGSSMLSQIINPSDNSTFLTFQASQDDGSNNGFVDNDTIQFKIWDKANQREMIANAVVYRKDVSSWISSGKFAAGSTAVVEIVSYTEYTQSISLLKGYNMISTYLSTSDPDVVSVTKSLNDDGSLIKIQDETGNSFENWGSFGGWINNLGSIQTTEGYKIKVANNCILQVTGRPIALPLDITLKSGWNIISFPRTDFVDAMSIIESLINQNKLIKVQDEKGNSIENWGAYGGWKNGIGNFLPGKAYKVKMNTDAILTIQEHYTKSAVIMAKAEETKYFSTDIEGNGSDHMNINLIGLIESGLSTGDELAAFDGELCVGTLKLTEDHLVQNSASLVTSFSTDDQYKSGFKVGNRIQIYVWNQESGNESEVQAEPVSGQLNFEKNASVWAKLKSATTGAKTGIEDLVSIDLFPNPSTGKVTVRFSTLPDDTNSRIEILDLSGRRITTRQITGTSEEFNLLQQPKGIYLVKTILGTDETVNKLIIN